MPQKIISMIRKPYNDMIGCVKNEGIQSDWCEIKSGVRQGCVLADLFSAPMDWILDRTFHSSYLGAFLGHETIS